MAARVRREIGDTLLLLEHSPVVTLGRGAHPENVLLSRAELEGRGVDLVETARGGDVTYHGPGQLVAYPIFDLHPDRLDVRRYVRDLARVMIALAGAYGVEARFLEGDAKLVGVWVDEASLGRGGPATHGRRDGCCEAGRSSAPSGWKISRWVTMHGFAFNVSTDLAGFRLIVPCGITRYGVTSLEALKGERSAPSLEAVMRRSVECFARVFDAEGRMAEPSENAGLAGAAR